MMPFARYANIIDQLSTSGCVWLLLTGGEPLLHPNFINMYKYAKRYPFEIKVFTNGSLLKPEHISVFSLLPPEFIEISIYGASSDSYNNFAGFPLAFEKMKENIDALIQVGVRVKLKALLASFSFSEIGAYREFAAQRGLEIRFDGFIVPRITGGKSMLEKFRIDPNDVVDFEFNENIEFSLAMKDKIRKQNIYNNALYSCGAAKSSVFIDANCNICACSFARNLAVDMGDCGNSILDAQKILLKMISQKKKLNETHKCFQCQNKAICRYCPGQFLLANNSEYIPISWHCEYAHCIRNQLEETSV
jgi:MoaA/NifB/PqqE/SkfB family radical SAM enzyme